MHSGNDVITKICIERKRMYTKTCTRKRVLNTKGCTRKRVLNTKGCTQNYAYSKQTKQLLHKSVRACSIYKGTENWRAV